MKKKQSRRRFLKSVSTGAAAIAAAPTLLLRSKAITLGSGDHTYEVVPGWGPLPEGVRYGYTHGVVVDSQQRIIVHNQSKDAVILFDNDGKFIQSWGADFQKGAHGMLIRKEGSYEYLYLADYVRHLEFLPFYGSCGPWK